MQPGIEGIVDVLMAYYEANLEAELNQRASEDVPLPKPADYRFGEWPLNAGRNYPVLFVFGSETEIGGSETRVPYNATMDDSGNQITAKIALRGTDLDVLARQRYRYVGALWALTKRLHFQTTGQPDHFFALATNQNILETFERERDQEETAPPYIKVASLSFAAERQEEGIQRTGEVDDELFLAWLLQGGSMESNFKWEVASLPDNGGIYRIILKGGQNEKSAHNNPGE